MEEQSSVRIFVGGLVPEVTSDELRGRFTSFGTVTGCELAPAKVYEGAAFHRGFGYVDLTPTNPSSLARCLASYNGSKWRGGQLRCSIARPTYRQVLEKEWNPQEVRTVNGAGSSVHDCGPNGWPPLKSLVHCV